MPEMNSSLSTYYLPYFFACDVTRQLLAYSPHFANFAQRFDTQQYTTMSRFGILFSTLSEELHELFTKDDEFDMMEKVRVEKEDRELVEFRKKQTRNALEFGLFWEQYHTAHAQRGSKEPSLEIQKLIQESGIDRAYVQLAGHLWNILILLKLYDIAEAIAQPSSTLYLATVVIPIGIHPLTWIIRSYERYGLLPFTIIRDYNHYVGLPIFPRWPEYEWMLDNPHIPPERQTRKVGAGFWDCPKLPPNQLMTMTVSDLVFEPEYPSERPSDHRPIKVLRVKAKSVTELLGLNVEEAMGIKPEGTMYRGLSFSFARDCLRDEMVPNIASGTSLELGAYATPNFQLAVSFATCGLDDDGAAVLLFKDVDVTGLSTMDYTESNRDAWAILASSSIRGRLGLGRYEAALERFGEKAVDDWIAADLVVGQMIGNLAEVEEGGEPVATTEKEFAFRKGAFERLQKAICGVLIMELNSESP
ncbi:hypothetical protein BJ508DRAFT_362731 [Ascobolus immersus RN42]|uniref:Uncharacterized protein n=1 Tax=Ascobolus immersus RN42 TaxID=1160509 RepID=A0A3N4I415_ASCIM|nr:hypothetical protein BJ508DRAFT_362731 [Ascobolus immersus RN42]